MVGVQTASPEKARQSACLDYRSDDEPVSWVSVALADAQPRRKINEHTLARMPKTNAIYALQRDYSFRQLSLSNDEVAELLSRITQSEARTDALYEQLLDVDPCWQQKVVPKLRIVGKGGCGQQVSGGQKVPDKRDKR
jgi:hypothetical protein